MERLTVGQVKEALNNMPDDAWIRCMEGGFLEVPIHLIATEVRLEAYGGDANPVVHTFWQ